MQYLYIDQGPYLPSLEHLVQHYMRFSDGLPVNLRYPVPPKPKPPLPEANRNKFFNTIAGVSPDRSERKLSADHFHTAKRPQRNLSIPSDDLMNQVGILSTSPNATKIDGRATSNSKRSPGKSPSDNLKFGSLRLPKPNSIIDGMRSLTRSKKEAKNRGAENVVTAAPVVCVSDDPKPLSNLPASEEISPSLKNLTFSADFKPNDLVYNTPTNNCAVTADDIQNKNATAMDETISASHEVLASGDDLFTRSDKLIVHHDISAYDKDNSVEEIYFVDAPTKTLPIQSINYVAFKQVPFFPDGTPYTCHETASNLTTKELRSDKTLSTISSASNESEFLLSLQRGTSQDSTNTIRSQTQRPNYYIPKSSIILNEVLGRGEFASVHKGIMKCDSPGRGASGPTEIPVAIKTLHDEHCKENRAEFLREASVMIKLSHHCIVKLIGISKVRDRRTMTTKFEYHNANSFDLQGPPLMIVQELVGLGSLLNYLLENSQTINPNFELKIWASQIACGESLIRSNNIQTKLF